MLRKFFESENRAFGLIIVILVVACLYFYYTNKQPWQMEAEQFVKKNIPIGTKRSRLSRLRLGKYYIRAGHSGVVRLTVWNHDMQNKLTGLHDTVVVEIYFDADDKVSGFGSAYAIQTASLSS